MNILFSIVILTKDRPELLQRAVLSALDNLTNRGELIVVDDHSTPAAESSLARFTDERLSIVRVAKGHGGIAAARNVGLEAARGDVVFFLDDDDTMERGYCEHVLSNALDSCDYGFSAYHQVNKDGEIRIRTRFEDGPISERAPIRKRICGFGMGFWIKSAIAKEAGLVSTDLSINEDTDYICRLITLGKSAWYTANPSISVYSAHHATTDIANITKTTAPDERARCMRIVCERFPEMIGHLGTSYIRHCAKSGAFQEAQSFIREQPEWGIRFRFSCLLFSKIFMYRIASSFRLRSARA